MGALDGFTVGVTADRRGDEQAMMLARLGSRVVRGPAIATVPLADHRALRHLTAELIAHPPAYLVANTGIGIRSWFAMASTWGRHDDLVGCLGGTRIVARGPKAAGAVTTAGLEVWWRAPSEQLDEVGRRLLAEGIRGQRVAVQLHGDSHLELAGLLRGAGADVVELPIYRWMVPDHAEPALRLIELTCKGSVDALTFTSGPAVTNFVGLARQIGTAGDLVAAMNGDVVVGCVGPVCAAAAHDEGVADPVVPDHWRLGSLVHAVAEALGTRRRRFRLGAVEVVFQGSLAVIDGEPIRLSDRERAVLDALVADVGRTVTRDALHRRVWGDPRADGHALEVVVGRLRGKLGPAGGAIETVMRRGYLLNGAPIS